MLRGGVDGTPYLSVDNTDTIRKRNDNVKGYFGYLLSLRFLKARHDLRGGLDSRKSKQDNSPAPIEISEVSCDPAHLYVACREYGEDAEGDCVLYGNIIVDEVSDELLESVHGLPQNILKVLSRMKKAA